MKNKFSIIACVLVALVLIQYRVKHSDLSSETPLKVTTWDALGYYMFLPGIFIYDDVTKYDWLTEIDKKYSVTGGGDFYQATRSENGNYVGKYLGGVAILELPFFFIGHVIAINSHYNADGFSPPYQYTIAFGVIFYCILALFLLRFILLKYFSDPAVALSIVLLTTATNFIQFVAIDSAQSHAFIFPLYVLMIYLSIKWHEQPRIIWAALIGVTLGLATISRPTEAIMLFIPLLWGTQNKAAAAHKWALVKQYLPHILWVGALGLVGILPQLIYWKIVSGDLIFNVGSKWYFLNPFFRVIVGFENGWMVYTPITILFVVGFFYIKEFPFKKSVIVFCLLNIWIITAWSDWKYGATYSTRALVQSYPIFALAFTAIVERILQQKWKVLFYAIGAYLIFVNLFQMEQYFTTVLHYRDMNRAYYGRIYLNPSPTPLDMSLMDTDEVLDTEDEFQVIDETVIDTVIEIGRLKNYSNTIAQLRIKNDGSETAKERWIKITATIKASVGFSNSYLNYKLKSSGKTKERKIRIFNPISQPGAFNNYAFFVEVPETFKDFNADLYFTSDNEFEGRISSIRISYLVGPL